MASMSLLFVNAEHKDVIIHPEQKTHNYDGNKPPRAPMRIPHVSIEEYTLMFDSVCSGCLVQVFQDDMIVFAGYVNEQGELQLPSELSGSYMMEFQLGSTIFVGELEL